MSKLVIGKTYKLKSYSNDTNQEKIIPLAETSISGRAIFVSTDFGPTPFISWGYNIINNDTLECYWGHYYTTLLDAVKEELPL